MEAFRPDSIGELHQHGLPQNSRKHAKWKPPGPDTRGVLSKTRVAQKNTKTYNMLAFRPGAIGELHQHGLAQTSRTHAKWKPSGPDSRGELRKTRVAQKKTGNVQHVSFQARCYR